MINTASERLKASHFVICWYFSFYKQDKVRAQLSFSMKKVLKPLYPWGLV